MDFSNVLIEFINVLRFKIEFCERKQLANRRGTVNQNQSNKQKKKKMVSIVDTFGQRGMRVITMSISVSCFRFCSCCSSGWSPQKCNAQKYLCLFLSRSKR